MIFLLWLILLVILSIFYTNKAIARFEKYGVHFQKPVPLLGNLFTQVFRLKHMSEEFDQLRKSFPNDRFVGRFQMLKPTIIVFDSDLIKRITVKDFHHFMNHRKLGDGSVDPLFGRNLIALQGQEWKEMRSTLTPVLTSSKMKLMIPFMKEIGEQMISTLKQRLLNSYTNFIDVETKDLASRYATDVIASCVFGIKVDSYSVPENQFYNMAKMTSHFGVKRSLVFLGYSTMPTFSKLIKLRFFEKDTYDFFKDLVSRVIKERETRNIKRDDMIQHFTEAKKDLTDDDLVAQTVTFLLSNFESVSTLMCFLLRELALNPDVQQRLYKEIKKHDMQRDENLDFGSIHTLKYLDMVVSETLRLWPPAIGTDRICTEDYNIGRAHEDASEDYIIRKGQTIFIPIWAIQHDPQNFPDPFKFDPERFSEENPSKIKPFTYLPFGSGPRNCIGSRFTLCEAKIMLCQILRHFELFPSEKTQIPVELSKDTFNLHLKGGHWIRIKLRQDAQ